MARPRTMKSTKLPPPPENKTSLQRSLEAPSVRVLKSKEFLCIFKPLATLKSSSYYKNIQGIQKRQSFCRAIRHQQRLIRSRKISRKFRYRLIHNILCLTMPKDSQIEILVHSPISAKFHPATNTPHGICH